jgi:hypothetical protein
MTLLKDTGTIRLDGNEDLLFVVGQGAATLHSWQAICNLKTMKFGDAITLKCYNHYDGPSQWKFDGDVNDSVGSNNGTITYNSNLKRLYKFLGNLNDSSASGVNASVGGGTLSYVSGPENEALSLNGASYATASDSGLPTGNNAVSVSCWINTSVTGGNQVIFAYGTASSNELFEFRILGSNKIDVTTNNAQLVTSNTVLSENTWYFITATWDGTTAKIYINGSLDNSATPSSLNLTLSGTAYIGQNFSQYLTGQLAELRIYNIALSAAQVSALYMVGEVGQSHTFDGGEYIQVGTALNYEGTQPLTIGFWIKHNSTGVEEAIISNLDSTNNFIGYEVFLGSSGNPAIWIINNYSGNNYLELNIANDLTDGLWHHVVFTYSGSRTGTGVSIYIDGSSVTPNIINNTLSGTSVSTKQLTFGARRDGTSPLTAQIDDLRIYDRVLSASEVSDWYNNPAQEMQSLIYAITYYGSQALNPPITPFIYLPYVSSIQYAVTAQQISGVPYKNIYWEYEQIT